MSTEPTPDYLRRMGRAVAIGGYAPRAADALAAAADRIEELEAEANAWRLACESLRDAVLGGESNG